MAWIEAWKSTAGYFTDVFFNTAIGNTNDIQWVNAPDPTGVRRLASYEGDSSSGLQTGEAIGLQYLKNFQKNVEFTLATFPIQGASENAEMRIKYKSAADPNLDQRMVSFGLFRRVIAADQTFVDTQFTPWIDILLDFTGSQTLYITEKISFDIGFLQYQNISYFVFGLHRTETFTRTGTLRYLDTYFCIPYTSWLTWAGGDIPPELIDPDFGPPSEEGGYGADPGSGGGSGGRGPTFDDTSDDWVPSDMPPGISNLGFLNIYKCDANSLVNLGSELFPEITWPTSLSDVGEVLAAVSDSIWNSKLIDFVISIHMVPVDVPAGNLEDIKLGARTMTGILARKVSSDYVEVNCGSLHIDEYYTSFADYMTRCRLFLPFYGFIDIKPEYWQSATLNVIYRFNIVDGTFIARVTSTVTRHQKAFTAMIGQYSGSACIHLPASGASYASIFSGVVSNAGGAAASMATGNVAAAGTSIMNTAAALGSGGEANYSNPYNASGSIMGHRVPYLLIERPVSHFSENYAVEKGIPLLVRKTIGSCQGFTIAEDAILDGIPATLEEKERIKQYLQSGVIIK